MIFRPAVGVEIFMGFPWCEYEIGTGLENQSPRQPCIDYLVRPLFIISLLPKCGSLCHNSLKIFSAHTRCKNLDWPPFLPSSGCGQTLTSWRLLTSDLTRHMAKRLKCNGMFIDHVIVFTNNVEGYVTWYPSSIYLLLVCLLTRLHKSNYRRVFLTYSRKVRLGQTPNLEAIFNRSYIFMKLGSFLCYGPFGHYCVN